MAASLIQTPAQKAYAIKTQGATLVEQYGEHSNVFMLSMRDITRELESILTDDDLSDYYRQEIENYLDSL